MTTLYRKEGRRYVPVHDTAAFEGLPDGTWLVVVEGGRRACIREQPTGPSLRAMAAVPRLEEFLVGLVREASRFKLSHRTDTPKHRKAWAAYLAVNPGADLWLEQESLAGIARAIAEGLARAADGGIEALKVEEPEHVG